MDVKVNVKEATACEEVITKERPYANPSDCHVEVSGSSAHTETNDWEMHVPSNSHSTVT